MVVPEQPEPERRRDLLAALAELIAAGGAAPLLFPPVVPGPAAFPEPWAPSCAGVELLVRRLIAHANAAGTNPRPLCGAVVLDELVGAPPTERKPATDCAVIELRPADEQSPAGYIAVVSAMHIGDDNVAGTLAHEVGVAHAMLARQLAPDPYRANERDEIDLDPERDHERGSIATVYLGLGVLAVNAAFQQYTRSGRFYGGYAPIEYDVLQAGYIDMSELAFLLAVQTVVRGDTAPPRGLEPPQRDEVTAWIAALRGTGSELRAELGITADAPAIATRPALEPFAAVALDEPVAAERIAFRWRTNRGGVGMVAGTVLGVGIAALVASRGAAPVIAIGSACAGHVLGRRVRVPRCSACSVVVHDSDTRCRACGAALRGDIASLSDRLEAEERLS